MLPLVAQSSRRAATSAAQRDPAREFKPQLYSWRSSQASDSIVSHDAVVRPWTWASQDASASWSPASGCVSPSSASISSVAGPSSDENNASSAS